MLHEHDLGRALVRQMAETLDVISRAGSTPATLQDFANFAREFSQLLMGHIQKEDQILYPMAESRFSDDDMLALETDFEQYESKAEALGTQTKYTLLAQNLCETYGNDDDIADEDCSDCSSCSHCG